MEGKRGSPFTQDEKDILKELVVIKSDIIENKKTDASTKKLKKDAWLWVEAEFNGYTNVTKRTLGQLKKAWDNMKTRLKKQQAADALIEKMLKGSGLPATEVPEDPLMELAVPPMLHWIPQDLDSDVSVHNSSSDSRTASAVVEILMEAQGDADGASDFHRSHLHSQSSLGDEMMDPLAIKAEESPTCPSRTSINLGSQGRSIRHTSWARDETVFGLSSTVIASSSGSSRRTPTLSTTIGQRYIPSAPIQLQPATTASSTGSTSDRAWFGNEGSRTIPSPAIIVPTHTSDSCSGSSIDSNIGVERSRAIPSARMVSPPTSVSSRGSPTESTLAGWEQSRAIPSATLVPPLSSDSRRNGPSVSFWCGGERSHSAPGSTVVRPLSSHSERRSPTVTSMIASTPTTTEVGLTATTPTTAAVASTSSVIAGRRTLRAGEDGERTQPRRVPPVGLTSATARRTAVPDADVAEDAPVPNSAISKLGVLREEHAQRIALLKTTAEQNQVIHDLRLREARADAEAAESRASAEAARARAELARAVNLEEELEYTRWRRRQDGFSRQGSPQP